MKVRIRRVRPNVQLPSYETGGAAAFDLSAAEAVTVEPRAVALVPTGLVVEVPAGMLGEEHLDEPAQILEAR